MAGPSPGFNVAFVERPTAAKRIGTKPPQGGGKACEDSCGLESRDHALKFERMGARLETRAYSPTLPHPGPGHPSPREKAEVCAMGYLRPFVWGRPPSWSV
eukprot:scaffold1522_cov340-Prasinococcus_capsulatus_cf.AAC.16